MSVSSVAGSSPAARLLFAICIAFSTFQLWTAAWSPLPSQIVRSVHVGFLLLLVFGLSAAHAGAIGRVLAWTFGFAGFGLGFYHWLFLAELIQRAGEPSTTDLVVGCAITALVFEAARRHDRHALERLHQRERVFLAHVLPEHLAEAARGARMAAALLDEAGDLVAQRIDLDGEADLHPLPKPKLDHPVEQRLGRGRPAVRVVALGVEAAEVDRGTDVAHQLLVVVEVDRKSVV